MLVTDLLEEADRVLVADAVDLLERLDLTSL